MRVTCIDCERTITDDATVIVGRDDMGSELHRCVDCAVPVEFDVPAWQLNVGDRIRPPKGTGHLTITHIQPPQLPDVDPHGRMVLRCGDREFATAAMVPWPVTL